MVDVASPFVFQEPASSSLSRFEVSNIGACCSKLTERKADEFGRANLARDWYGESAAANAEQGCATLADADFAQVVWPERCVSHLLHSRAQLTR